MKKIIIAVLVILLAVLVVTECMKVPIEEATYEQLIKIDGIGPVLAKAIVSSKPSSIDELLFDDELKTGVKYIGRERLKLLKKHFR
jgi:DNA uptake protein ComE-like DNA-binding protein